MDTVQMLNWLDEFNNIMSSGLPEQLMLDKLKALHKDCTEQPDMWDESIEEETERML